MQTDDDGPKIDQKWFQDQFRDRGVSQRKLAKSIGMDPSSLSLLLQGKRRLRVATATALSKALDIPLEEIIARAGGIAPVMQDPSGIPVLGTVDASWAATIPDEPLDHINPPGDFPRDAFAMRMRSLHTAADILDGWTGIFAGKEKASPDMVDRMGLVAIEGHGVVLGQVRRGHRANTYTVARSGGDSIQNAEVGWFAPLMIVVPK